MNIKPELIIENLQEEAKIFCLKESSHQEASLYPAFRTSNSIMGRIQ